MPSRLRTAGFTLIEAMISVALVGLIVAKLTIVMSEARHTHQEESISMALEDQASELIDRISYAVVGADAATLTPYKVAPLPAAELNYRVSMGVEDGKVVWGDPEIIGLNQDGGQVYWGQNPGQANERIVVWANTVSQLLQAELLNGVDDNGNDLADELGLSFVMDGKSVTVRLTLERGQQEGNKVQVTRETTVTCRNGTPTGLANADDGLAEPGGVLSEGMGSMGQSL